MSAEPGEEFREFMRGRWPAMVRLAYGLTGDLGHAEDVAQAAFARAYASCSRVRRTGDPNAYVARIVINENLSRFRKRRVAEDLVGVLPEGAMQPAADAFGDSEALLRALRKLAPRQRGRRAALPAGYVGGRDGRRAELLGRHRQEPGLPGAGHPARQRRARGGGTPVTDLRESLNSAFAAIDPGPAPVEAAMRAGRKIRNRRRAGVLAGAVVLVAAAVAGVPVVAHQLALPSPPAGSVRMTVNPPGPHARAGTIASGFDGSQPWSAGIAYPGTAKCVIFGTDVIDFNCKGMLPAASDDPISFADSGDPDDNSSTTNHISFLVDFGLVKPDVTSARVVLADGTVLTLHPVLVGGSRWVAFVAPLGVRVDSVTAYSRTGEIATAFPFSLDTGFPVFGQWLAPGQAAPKPLTVTLNSGIVNGTAWHAAAFVGPWGTCVGDGRDAGGFTCFASAQSAGTKLIGTGPGVWWGSAADSVSSVVVTLKDGSTRRVGVTEVGRQKFWAFYLGDPADVGAHWAAYDAAGQQVASGSVSEQAPPGSVG